MQASVFVVGWDRQATDRVVRTLTREQLQVRVIVEATQQAHAEIVHAPPDAVVVSMVGGADASVTFGVQLQQDPFSRELPLVMVDWERPQVIAACRELPYATYVTCEELPVVLRAVTATR